MASEKTTESRNPGASQVGISILQDVNPLTRRVRNKKIRLTGYQKEALDGLASALNLYMDSTRLESPYLIHIVMNHLRRIRLVSGSVTVLQRHSPFSTETETNVLWCPNNHPITQDHVSPPWSYCTKCSSPYGLGVAYHMHQLTESFIIQPSTLNFTADLIQEMFVRLGMNADIRITHFEQQLAAFKKYDTPIERERSLMRAEKQSTDVVYFLSGLIQDAHLCGMHNTIRKYLMN